MVDGAHAPWGPSSPPPQLGHEAFKTPGEGLVSRLLHLSACNLIRDS
jgi:hypothetical protein